MQKTRVKSSCLITVFFKYISLVHSCELKVSKFGAKRLTLAALFTPRCERSLRPYVSVSFSISISHVAIRTHFSYTFPAASRVNPTLEALTL